MNELSSLKRCFRWVASLFQLYLKVVNDSSDSPILRNTKWNTKRVKKNSFRHLAL